MFIYKVYINSLKSRKNIHGLTKALLKSKIANIREEAANALGAIGNDDTIYPLCEALKDIDWHVRNSAANALGAIGNDDAIDPLCEELKDTDWHVRNSAVKALGIIGSDKTVEPICSILEDERDEVRKSATIALGDIGHAGATKHLINRSLWGGNSNLQYYAAEALGKIGSEEAVPDLHDFMLGDPSRFVVKSAIKALGKIGNAEAVESLILGLKEGSIEIGNIREAALEALEKINNIEAMNAFIKALNDEDEDVRKAAVKVLSKLKWKPTNDENGAVYYIHKGNYKKCIEIGKPAINPLIKASGYTDTCKTAIKALSQIGKISINQLNKILQDENEDVYRAAVNNMVNNDCIDWKGRDKLIISVPVGGDTAKGYYLGYVLDSKLGPVRIEAEAIEVDAYGIDRYTHDTWYHGTVSVKNIKSANIKWGYQAYDKNGSLIAHIGIMAKSFEELLSKCP